MTSKHEQSDDIALAPARIDTSSPQNSRNSADLLDENGEEKKKNSAKSFANFLYNPRRRTVLGRGALNWAKLAVFYAVFYFFLGCFFVALVYVFASILDRREPRYYNTESRMAVRSPTAVVGMGFRPQPSIDSSLIVISDELGQQQRIASSLRLFRDVFLLQSAEAQTADCSAQSPASSLPSNTACAFNWLDIVEDQNHPCSDNNLYGFKSQQPCVLVKLNKVYGWTPIPGVLPMHIQKIRGVRSNKTVSNSDVYITCAGTNPADDDVITNITYYSVRHPLGSPKYGVIPNYFFPFQNAKDHVQPFVLVQLNKLPPHRLVAVTCRAWAPGIEHNTKGVRGMVNFQLYRTRKNTISNDNTAED